MKFDFKKFFKNIKFFILCIAVIVGCLLLSIFVDLKYNNLEEVELSDGNVTIGSLVLNEIMTSNKGVISSSDGKLYDYVEIYNGNDHEIDLKGYGLSDESSVKWVFPETIIKPKGYLIVYLGGVKSDELITNFKLRSSGGETLALFKPNGKVVDAVETVALESNTVMARDTEGKWVMMSKPTPGKANTIDGYNEFLNDIKIVMY